MQYLTRISRLLQRGTPLISLLLMIVTASDGLAGGILELGQHGGYTTNLFQNYHGTGSAFSATALNMEYRTAHLNLAYRGHYSLLSPVLEADTHKHTAILEFASRMGASSHWLRMGGTWGRQFTEAGSLDYEYSEPSLYAEWLFEAHQQSRLSAGLSFRERQYLLRDEYSFREQSLFARWSRSFNTGTSLQVESRLGQKSYLTQASDTVTSPSHFSGRLRVAQSVRPSMGIWAQWSGRHLFTPDSRYLDVEDSYILEEGFDDIYQFNTSQWQIGSRWAIDASWQLGTTLSYARDAYPLRPIFDLEGELIADGLRRRDQILDLAVSLDGSLNIPILDVHSPMSLRYSLAWHESNDAYHDFSQHTVSIGWQWAF